MRHFIIFVLIFCGLNAAVAQDLRTQATHTKDESHLFSNPGTPDGRPGGENMDNAVVIDALPFDDTGNTTDNLDDYDAICPYNTPGSPDVVYSFTPSMDMFVTVDLCGSGYDTKTYIMEADQTVVACNDDAYSGDPCGQWVSMIEVAQLFSGVEYFLVIDGYGGSSGDYILHVEEYIPPPPCIVPCFGEMESEPPLEDEYIDEWNGGCNSPEAGNPMQFLGNNCYAPDNLSFCGKSGWHNDGKDTDWFSLVMGITGTITWTLDAEQPVWAFHLSVGCEDTTILQEIVAGPCEPATMEINGFPGEVIWLWVGPIEFTPPSFFIGHEFGYQMIIDGLQPYAGVTASESVTFDGLKALYR